ncbi:YisL family protein [Metabacillus arenae]|uniref:UPF0344 protein IC621_10250 n=1 Tax=Metabacillus arenae TaxID=2771434 RepID=A0A926RX47_9BACI|nr:YisL family protein [Metabacillus arenae]MBD1380611.1 YisL family protein [Metabacillus arenae]
MTHAHITSWLLAIILFFVTNAMMNAGKEKPAKILHMILRVLYILIIVTGVQIVLGLFQISGEYIGKIVFGLWTVVMMELILVRNKKGKSTKAFWIQFVIVLILTLLLGFRLPLGFQFF